MKADVLGAVALGLVASLSNNTAEVVEDTVVVTSAGRVITLERQRDARLEIRVGDLDGEDRGNNSGGDVGSRVPLGSGVVKEEVNGVLAQTDKVDALVLNKTSDSLDVLALGPSIGVVNGAEEVSASALEELDDRLGATVEIKLAGGGDEDVRWVLLDEAGKLVPLVDGDVGGEAEVAHDILHSESLVGEEDIELGVFLATESVHQGSGDFVVGTGGLGEHDAQRLIGVLGGSLLVVAHPRGENAIIGGEWDLPTAGRSRNG
ncbi:hypothetical protein HG531_007565 [Fusarium graminearum]|nr:hypothetical protein HG531_007565 [Fusarium graminearum]